jgi:two-component system, NarL family, response regulator DegU
MTSPCDAGTGESGENPTSSAGTRRSLRVLVVDDHLLARCFLRRSLEEIPDLLVVGEAIDGLEAVALARTLSPDLVFMDINMPEMDGLEATRRIAEAFPYVRVIVHSSHDNQSIRQAALAAGAAAYLVKGQTPERLAETILSVFGPL